MKRIFLMVLAVCLVLSLAACGDPPATTGKSATNTPTTNTPTTVAPPTTGAQPTTPSTTVTPPTSTVPQPPHTHESDTWIVDKDNHWMECECGEMINVAEHFIEDDICVTCSAEIYVMSDGSTCLRMYNDYFDCILYQEYDANGNLTQNDVSEITYDEEGNILTVKSYSFGTLYYEVEYAPAKEDGTVYMAKETIYEEDGSKYYFEYDELGTNTLQICYDADGNVTLSLRYENSYDDQDNLLKQVCFDADTPLWETHYAVIVEPDMSWTYLQKEITYYEDGSKEIFEYSEEGELISEGYYDADGNPIDSSSKFNTDACAPLFGTWEGDMEVTGEMTGMPMLEGMNAKVHLSYTFGDQGELKMSMVIDPQSLLDFMCDMLYDSLGSEGMTRDEIDALFQQEYGMSVREYAESMLLTDDMQSQLQMEESGFYYVEDGKIFLGGSWTGRFEGNEFHLESNTLRFSFTSEDAELAYEVVLTKAES